MAVITRSQYWARLRRLPGQLLLAIVNGTAVLLIIAAVLVWIVTARIEHFAGSVASKMTDAVLSKVDLPSKEVLLDLRHLKDEVRALRKVLGEAREDQQAHLRSELDQLRNKITSLNVSIDRLRDARSILTEDVIARSAGAIITTFISRRSCSPSPEEA